jgi:hypothetical protein
MALSVFLPGLIEAKNASMVKVGIPPSSISIVTSPIALKIKPLETPDRVSAKIQSVLLHENHHALVAALAHGSIGTCEIVNYSDYDGILIIDESKLTSEDEILKLRKLIGKTSVMMREQDALQHHGWQIIFQSDMLQYSDSDFPLVTLENSKSIFPNSDITLTIGLDTQQDYEKGLKLVGQSILKKLYTQSYLRNFYSFKNFVSEVLLIPALYVQAKTNKSVFKRESFALARTLDHSIDWTIIDSFSELRATWTQPEAIKTQETKAYRYRAFPFLSNIYHCPLPTRYKEWCDEKTLQEFVISLQQSINTKMQ